MGEISFEADVGYREGNGVLNVLCLAQLQNLFFTDNVLSSFIRIMKVRQRVLTKLFLLVDQNHLVVKTFNYSIELIFELLVVFFISIPDFG